MDEADRKAFEPVPFPEVGLGMKFNVNFCRNPMCPNFGPAPDAEAYAARYTMEAVKDRPRDRTYKCKFCETSYPLLSNRSLRAAYAWSKRQSIPFAACPKPGCENEGLNLFEYRRRYACNPSKKKDKDPSTKKQDEVSSKKKGKDPSLKVRCSSCQSEITLGEPMRLQGDESEIAERLGEVFKSAHDRGGLGNRVNNLLSYQNYDIGQSRYLRTLASLAPRMRDFHSYCNAGLLAEDYPARLERLSRDGNGAEMPDALPGSPFNGVATLHSDAMSISLRRPNTNYEQRHQQLQIQVTALRIDRSHEMTEKKKRGSTYFILAAHPFVVLEKGNRSQKSDRSRGEMFEDADLPVAERRYDHLLHEGTDHGKDAALKGSQAYLGTGGLFMRTDYAELAHFMVVKDLTKRFRRVTLCMDGNKSAYRSAAAVFAEDMLTGCDDGGMECRRAEIAIVQARRRSGGRVSPEEQDRICDMENERVVKEWDDRLAGELEKGGGVDLGDTDRKLRTAKAKVKLFRQLVFGGFSGGETTWGWRERPTQKGNRLLAVLWLSQGPDRNGPPNGIIDEFLRRASLQSVDTAIKGFRDSVPPARRPENRADDSRSYYRSSQNAEIVLCYIWLYCFLANYRELRTEPRNQRASLLGLMRREDLDGFKTAERLQFRLGRDHAIEITQKVGHVQETLPRRNSARTVLPAVGSSGSGGRQRGRALAV